MPQDELASPQVRSREAQSERVSPQVPQSQEPLRWPEKAQPQVPPGAEQPALPRALPFQLQPPAPQVSQASVAQPQAL
jgi:hypothetical protein